MITKTPTLPYLLCSIKQFEDNNYRRDALILSNFSVKRPTLGHLSGEKPKNKLRPKVALKNDFFDQPQ